MKATVAYFAPLAASASAFMNPMPLAGTARTSSGSSVSMMANSRSIPFMPQPEKLDGTLPGDVGFDPLGLSALKIDFTEVGLEFLPRASICIPFE